MATPYLSGVGFLTKGRVVRNFVVKGDDPNKAGNYLVDSTCPFCNKVTTLSVPRDGLTAYQQGAFIQNAFPNLSADEREQLLTGICPPCWEDTFSGAK